MITLDVKLTFKTYEENEIITEGYLKDIFEIVKKMNDKKKLLYLDSPSLRWHIANIAVYGEGNY